MRKLRIGVWINANYQPEAGGGFGYYSQIINAVDDYQFSNAEIIYVSRKFSENWSKKNKSYEIKTLEFKNPSRSLLQKFVRKIAKSFGFELQIIENSKQKKNNEQQLKAELAKVVDLIYYPIPGCSVPNFPYIYTLWDVGHLSMYAFPEVSMNGVFESRKHHHEIFPQKALLVFCESEAGKIEAINYLSLNKDKIKVVPIFPSEIVSEKISLLKPSILNENSFFIHYPAQFWSHKNHYNLLLAFQIVVYQFPNLKLILSGSDKGNKNYILGLINELDLSNSVIDLGFIKNEELKWIYRYSQGLVMPTFLGPTNMPLLEAAELGCAVACSNLKGHQEQLGNYADYFDPKDSEQIAQTIIKMIKDNENKKQRVYVSNFNIKNALHQIDLAFSEAQNIRFCWGSNDKIF